MSKQPIDQTSVSIVLFFIAFLLFIGMFVVVPRGNVAWSFFHLFFSWALVILLLWLNSREPKNHRSDRRTGHMTDTGEDLGNEDARV